MSETSPAARRLARAGTLVLIALLGFLAACAPLAPSTSAPDVHAVRPVVTEHSDALACLGRAIDRSGRPPVVVHVTAIDDQTVPREYDERRLSSGAAWWLHTAMVRLGTRRVISTLDDPAKAPRTSDRLVLSGAWTQDDVEVSRAGGMVDLLLSRVGLSLGGRRSTDVIAADFVSVRQGEVVHATGISLTLGAASRGGELRIEDGRREVRLDLSQRAVDGPQYAQRRITEAAVLVHMARAFGLDYRPCLKANGRDPGRA